MIESPIILYIIGQLALGAAIYGGIRADLRAMYTRLDHAEKSVTDAHNRIDRLLERSK